MPPARRRDGPDDVHVRAASAQVAAHPLADFPGVSAGSVPRSAVMALARDVSAVRGAQLEACFVFEQCHGQELPICGPEARQGMTVGPAHNIG
jgi:hypothetical protein